MEMRFERMIEQRALVLAGRLIAIVAAGDNIDQVTATAVRQFPGHVESGMVNLVNEFIRECEEEGYFGSHSVTLQEFGPNKLAVIKIVRRATGLGLKDAKDLVEAAPQMVRRCLTLEQADALKTEIEQAGGQAYVEA